MNQAVEIALARNPRLAAQAEIRNAAQGRLVEARLWPNPELEAATEEGRANRGAGFGGDNKITAGIWQPIPLSGRIGARTALAKREVEVHQLFLEQERRALTASVRRAFYRALARERAWEIADATRDFASELHQAADIRVQVGAAPEMERIRAEIELAEAEAALDAAKAAAAVALQALLVLLGDVDAEGVRLDGELREDFPSLDPDRIRPSVEEGYPLLLAVRKDVERARADLDLAKVDWFDDPRIGIGAGRLREDGEDHAILEWGISIPLPIFDRNQGRIAESRALIRNAQRVYDAIRVETLRRMESVLHVYEGLRGQVARYRDRILPQAEQAIGLIREGYRQGKFTQLDLLDAQRRLSVSRLTYMDLIEDLQQTAAEIEELSGASIDTFKRE